MALKSIIIDDELSARDIMTYMLGNYCPNIQLVGTADGVRTGRSLITRTDPDLVFLDVNMKDGSGFDLLKSFTNIDFNVVFVTAYSEFDLQAFNHGALDYLLKPVAKDELIRTIERIELIKRLKSGLSPLSKYIVDTRL